MNLTKAQADAVTLATQLVETRTLGAVIGYAGTGKSTVVRAFPDVAIRPFIIAPTGKAALRAKEATGISAQTIHRWLYRPYVNPKTDEITFVPRTQDELKDALGDANLIVVDEASMITPDIWKVLHAAHVRTGVGMLLVGDGFQLPPVMPRNMPSFCALDVPPTRVQLTEVMRQALDSPVLHAATLVRRGNPRAALGMLSRFESDGDDVAALARGAALIAHRNATRQKINWSVRRDLGRTEPDVQPGEPLLVRKNDYTAMRFNGEVVPLVEYLSAPERLKTREGFDQDATEIDIRLRRATIPGSLDVDPAVEVVLCIEEMAGKTDDIKSERMRRAVSKWSRGDFLARRGQEGVAILAELAERKRQFTWADIVVRRRGPPPYLSVNLGYCLTCHAAQGSQWDEVIVLLEDSIRLSNEDGRRWLYTAITRAKEKCWLV